MGEDEPRAITLERRTPAGTMRYLAAKLRDGSIAPEMAALLLETQATLLEPPAVDDVAGTSEKLLAEMRRLYRYATLESHMLIDGVLYLRCGRCKVHPVPHDFSFIQVCDPCLDEMNAQPLSR